MRSKAFKKQVVRVTSKAVNKHLVAMQALEKDFGSLLKKQKHEELKLTLLMKMARLEGGSKLLISGDARQIAKVSVPNLGVPKLHMPSGSRWNMSKWLKLHMPNGTKLHIPRGMKLQHMPRWMKLHMSKSGTPKPWFASMIKENSEVRHEQKAIDKDITNIIKEAKVISTGAMNIDYTNRRLKSSLTTSTTTTLPPACIALMDKTTCRSRLDCLWANNLLGKKECREDVNYHKTCYAFGKTDCNRQFKKAKRCSYRSGVCDPKGCRSEKNWKAPKPTSPRRRMNPFARRRGSLVEGGRISWPHFKLPKLKLPKLKLPFAGGFIRRRRVVSCFSYIWNDWCDLTGETTRHWHQKWGSIENWVSKLTHTSAAQACCACGGGKSTKK